MYDMYTHVYIYIYIHIMFIVTACGQAVSQSRTSETVSDGKSLIKENPWHKNIPNKGKPLVKGNPVSKENPV